MCYFGIHPIYTRKAIFRISKKIYLVVKLDEQDEKRKVS